MIPREVERWTLEILDRHADGALVEDARVEFKANWPEPAKAARRIAGLCNAARGDDVLWVVGYDEKNGVVGAPTCDLAHWLPSVVAQFVDLPPRVTDVLVTYGEVKVHTLAFHSLRPPYLVKNPEYGKSGNVVETEVPWRDGTAIRTARRDELLTLLIEADRLPDVELLAASAVMTQPKQSQPADLLKVFVTLEFYVIPRSKDSVVLPLHRIKGNATCPFGGEKYRLSVYSHNTWETESASMARFTSLTKEQKTVVVNRGSDEAAIITRSEVIIQRACRLKIGAVVELPIEILLKNEVLQCEVEYAVGISRLPLRMQFDAKLYNTSS